MKKALVSVLVAALTFLAAWILTVNFYVTWKAFERQASATSEAFRLGFLVAGLVGAAAFGVTLYLLQFGRTRPKSSR
ncbi:MAG TPA: hypothetical protein VI455_01345 [Terriglobia bacterium]